jgi:hypothetical protein
MITHPRRILLRYREPIVPAASLLTSPGLPRTSEPNHIEPRLLPWTFPGNRLLDKSPSPGW